MPNIDISRNATDFTKHYRGVRMQQGRVLTDDDFNEAGRIEAEDARRVTADVIGPAGSPDDGFRLDVNPQGKLVLKKGTFYVGGLRLELENDELFEQQDDWLEQSDPGATGGILKPAKNQLGLVWLKVWQQGVTATEDNELYEVALGGADTSARVRIMSRAMVLANVGTTDCGTAWKKLQASQSGQGKLNGDFELVTDTTLLIGPDGSTGSGDLCSPSVKGGYLGADNQAIRVQLVDSGTFTWGFDNGAPLYRVTLGADSNGKPMIQFLNQPKDQAHYPLEGQVVEILPWSAVLPNNEKLAELSGFLTTVSQGYDPDTQSLLIAASPAVTISPKWGLAWQDRADKATLAENPNYFYLRVWNRGSDITSAPAMAFTAGTPVSLGNTGLQVTLYGTEFRSNDFWTIAARPDTPDQFVPWSIAVNKGRAAQGVRCWIAPLGIIRWTNAANPTLKVVHDCRPTFIPLTRIRGCCTYTVGDGDTSHGNFDSIQAAVDALPLDEGGQICLLPGIFKGGAVIKRRRNITIQGCGLRSRVELTSGAAGHSGAAVFLIEDSVGITIERMAIAATGANSGILVSRLPMSTDIRLFNLQIWAETRSGIEVQNGLRVKIDSCAVRMADLLSAYPAIFLTAREGWVERNALLIDTLPVAVAGRELPVDESPSTKPVMGLASREFIVAKKPATGSANGIEGRGGLQLGGGCRIVSVRENLIDGGFGNGITLGSFRLVGENSKGTDTTWVINAGEKCEGCEYGGVVVSGGSGGSDSKYIVSGPLYDIVIRDNRIYDMGLCGIGVAGFYNLADAKEIVTIYGLSIEHNDIQGCLTRQMAEFDRTMVDMAAYGAISLAAVEDLRIYDNNVSNNGLAVGTEPICGIFVLAVDGADLCRNRILDNGPETVVGNADQTKAKGPALMVGRRGGISIAYAMAPQVGASRVRTKVPAQAGGPAARIHDNIVVAPIGPALSLMALGPVSVENNEFTSRGIDPSAATRYSAATVFILNLASATELDALRTFESYVYSASIDKPGSGALGSPEELKNTESPRLNYFIDGDILFVGNQVTLEALGSPEPAEIEEYARLVSAGALKANLRSSVLIAGLDDIGFADNQCQCLIGEWARIFLMTDAIVIGFSVRMADNRLKEVAPLLLYSGFTSGKMNATTNNQSSRCILAYGPISRRVYEGNRILMTGFQECSRFVDDHMKAALLFPETQG